MEKDLIFFGQEGITDTRANQIADLAKLTYTDSEAFLESISFIDAKVETINGDNQKDLVYGTKDLSNIDSMLERIGNLKALGAWLREAVSAHQRLLNEVKTTTLRDYAEMKGVKVPELPSLDSFINENDVIASFDIKKRNHYYWLEAMAATIGQVIHKGGSLDMARKHYYEKLSHPRNAVGSGNDMIIYTYMPSIEKEEIEDTFYGLQQKHTAFQSELNSIKSEIKSRITNDEIDKNRKYSEEYNKYDSEYRDLVNQFNMWKAEEQKRIAGLKIVIPNALKSIYDAVAATGKKGITNKNIENGVYIKCGN